MNPQTEMIDKLADLLQQTGEAHHHAFIETNGVDEDWSIWYADYLHDKVSTHLGARLSRSEIVYLLMSLSYEHAQQAPSSSWTRYYASELIRRYRR